MKKRMNIENHPHYGWIFKKIESKNIWIDVNHNPIQIMDGNMSMKMKIEKNKPWKFEKNKTKN
jgi:hypothetical protein